MDVAFKAKWLKWAEFEMGDKAEANTFWNENGLQRVWTMTYADQLVDKGSNQDTAMRRARIAWKHKLGDY